MCLSKSSVSIKITKLMKGKMGNYCYSYNSNSKINSICWLRCVRNPTHDVSHHTFPDLQHCRTQHQKPFTSSFFFFFWESTTHSKWSAMAPTIHSMKQQQHLSLQRACVLIADEEELSLTCSFEFIYPSCDLCSTNGDEFWKNGDNNVMNSKVQKSRFKNYTLKSLLKMLQWGCANKSGKTCPCVKQKTTTKDRT